MMLLEEFVLSRKLFVVAHRGSSGTAPENTMSAFRQALDVGADMIETDIQFSGDNKIIIFHDKALKRTTNSIGSTNRLSYKELKELDAGNWFDPKFKGEKIPLLEELIDEIKGKVFLNIEIKPLGSNGKDHHLQGLVDILNKKSMDGHVLLSSFDYEALKTIKNLNPKLPTAAIKLPKDGRKPSEIAKETGCQAFVCAVSEINDEISDDALKSGIYIGVYPVDDSKYLNHVLNLMSKQ
jgi:glycerophosphoryl diester phosphodiesterase